MLEYQDKTENGKTDRTVLLAALTLCSKWQPWGTPLEIGQSPLKTGEEVLHNPCPRNM
jgi:hypothetical protein